MKAAQKHFLKAKKRSSSFILNDYVSNSLFNWSNLSDLNQSLIELKKLGVFQRRHSIYSALVVYHIEYPICKCHIKDISRHLLKK